MRTRAVGAALLLLLPAVAVWVALEGRSDEATARASEAGGPAAAASANTPTPAAPATIPEARLPPVPAGAYCLASDPPEHYDEATLYEKIDGAAPAYFERGFRALLTQTYAPRDPERFGCELFLYDMGTPANAAAIFADQRGAGAAAVAVGREGYRAGASWFFHAERYYVIVLNADEGADAERFSEQIARGVDARIRGGAAR